ncbi:hypothetical protein O9H85_26570 [Paenibacillus filicis]|uniref:CxxH/CxxC protein n=1 Tax=Paenibacillus gyeongsangnamensis TaxID=3388067 RepID=A0ABT4QG86_9BACL|nr:hypothetical protein [Paenibacillus filicis]MCZ8515898.1 hypothetical protein [Paenibacillus filicis]
MNSCYKVRACCSTYGCDYVAHKDVIRTINHESSFSFCMYANSLTDQEFAMKCPECGKRMFLYPVTQLAEVLYYE